MKRSMTWWMVAAAMMLGCGGSSVVKKRRTPPATTTSSLRSTRMGTPPAGATMMGTMTRPTVGTNGPTVPVTDAVVYAFQADVFGTGLVTVFFAYDGATMKSYFWASLTGVACENTGGTGDAVFMMEVKSDGSGSYILGVSGCTDELGAGGCEFDTNGNETTCGACAVSGQDIACVAAGT